ncbi:MAG TPA: hypothetical protein DIW52_19480 [Pseudomonas sp.]|nr:hypothetical protein [Pseudomonas sp.]
MPVGASLLAKVVNENAPSLTPRGALKFFASKLAPTVIGDRAEPVIRSAFHPTPTTLATIA